jgi:hypothetical protein
MAESMAPSLHPIHLAAEVEKAHRGADKFDHPGKSARGRS